MLLELYKNLSYNFIVHIIIIFLASSIIYQYLKNKNCFLGFWSFQNILYFIIISVALSQIESIILGPNARREWGDDARCWTGFMPYLAKAVGQYSFNIFGGVDINGIAPFGAEFISGRKVLFYYLQPWAAFLALRLLNPFVAISGMYLLLSKRFGVDVFVSLLIGILFSVALDYNSILTFQYGLSLTAFPLLAFLISCSASYANKILLLIFWFVYISLSSPFYTMPMFLLFLASLSIIFQTKLFFPIKTLILLLILWVINYIPQILSFIELMPESARAVVIISNQQDFIQNSHNILRWVFNPNVTYNAGGLFVCLVSLFIISEIFVSKNYYIGFRILIVISLILFLGPALKIVPWEMLNLKFLSSYRWYLEYIVPILLLIIGADCYKRLQSLIIKNFICSMILGMSCTYLFVQKIQMIENQSFAGNMSHQFSVPNLIKKDLDLTDGKAIGLPYLFDPNTLPYYNISTIQGWGTIYNARVKEFWDKFIINKTENISQFSFTASEGVMLPLIYEDFKKDITISKYVNLSALRILGVDKIISAVQLHDSDLECISSPPQNVRSNLYSRIVSPSLGVYIYKIKNSLPLVYASNKIREIEGFDMDITSVIENSLQGIIHVKKDDLINQLRYHDSNGKYCFLKNVNYSISTDAIICENIVNQHNIVINFPFSRFWKARDLNSGENIPIYPCNVAQMFIQVPQNSCRVAFEYCPPDFRWIIRNYISECKKYLFL